MQRSCSSNKRLQIQRARQLTQNRVQHLRLITGRLKELSTARAHDGGEHVDAEDGLAREEHVEEARDVAERRDVVRVHGQGAGEGEEGLDRGEVPPELGVRGAEDVGQEPELGDGRGEGGEHEVADAEGGEAGDGGVAEGRGEDEEQDLADVVVALEVAEVGVAAEDGEDEGGEVVFLAGEFGFVLDWGNGC